MQINLVTSELSKCKKVAERQASYTLEYLVRKFSRITTMYLGTIGLLTTIEAYVRP